MGKWMCDVTGHHDPDHTYLFAAGGDDRHLCQRRIGDYVRKERHLRRAIELDLRWRA